MATTGKEPFARVACLCSGGSFESVAGLDLRDFIFALLLLLSLRLAPGEALNPMA
jgi:hypothetical protein